MSAALAVGWQWLQPAWLLTTLVMWSWSWWRRRHGTAVPFAVALPGRLPSAPLPRTWRQRLVVVPTWLEVAALALVGAALARPVFVETTPPSPPGRDLVLCLDKSSSMLAQDLQPGRSRLDVVRQLAAEFAARRQDDRIGCVEFARYVDLRCPPTLDHDTVGELLAAVQPVAKDGPEDATAIGGAVAFAANVLQRSPATGRVLVLLTDGEENVATAASPQEIAPAHAAQLCVADGVRVYTIVVGRGNRAADGSVVALDTTAVQQLAQATGGRSFPATDAAALRDVFAAIDGLEGVAFALPKVVVTEWFPAALGSACLLMLLAFAWSRTRGEVLP